VILIVKSFLAALKEIIIGKRPRLRVIKSTKERGDSVLQKK